MSEPSALDDYLGWWDSLTAPTKARRSRQAPPPFTASTCYDSVVGSVALVVYCDPWGGVEVRRVGWAVNDARALAIANEWIDERKKKVARLLARLREKN